jgi:hypothetical protein
MDVIFRAIHEVASRIMQAAYDRWKKAELAKIAPRQTPRRRSGGGVAPGGVLPGSR